MIISKTPLRITFTGGGTDLPEYYRNFGEGAVISASINKYIYIVVNKKFDDRIRVSYSVTEIVDRVDQIRHPTVREALRLLNIDGGIEIVSISDIPSTGTGLGSSSTFLVGLLHALHAYSGEYVSQRELAEEAVKIEREILREPGGKQDQYMAAYGGIQFLKFLPDENVVVRPVIIPEEARERLWRSLFLMYTGIERRSQDIHREQSSKVSENVDSYREMVRITEELYKRLSRGEVDSLGESLHRNWMLKKTLAGSISSGWIDELYERAMSNGGARGGGKLIGAGGGEDSCYSMPPDVDRRNFVSKFPELREEPFAFDYQGGSQIIFVGD
ncbi:kinase [Thermogymnomonas acidicola]|uniref:GHMP family kinase ATP-binding protein n=1 Tax=Thermogymnomonas acidicola TaxID=399579 RepID=UPI0009465BBB|nr:kinase [Thermogymnomonas acidicola]